MVSSQLKEWAILKGWKTYNNCIYGEYDEYLFTAFDGSGFKALATHLPALSDNEKKGIINFLNINSKRLRIHEYSATDNLIIIKIKKSLKPVSMEQIENILKEVTGFLKNQNIVSKGICSICGTETSTEPVFINNIVTRMCDSCHQTLAIEVENANREYEEQDKNYLRGVIGALMGGAVGAVLWVIVGSYMNIVASILGYLIGKGSLTGYFKLKGKIGKPTRWIIVFITIFWVVAAELTQWGIFFAQNEYAISFGNFIITYTDPEIAVEAWGQLGMALLMAFLGISSIFKTLKNDLNSVVPTIKKVEI